MAAWSRSSRGVDRLVAVAEAMKRGHDGRQLGDQADDRVPVALGVGDVAGRVEHAHGGHAGLQGVHRMAGFGQALDQVLELVLDAAMMPELVVEVGQLALGGQVALEQQPGGFLETAFAGQGLDGDAAVLQAGAFAVDEADRRLRHRHVRQARPILHLTHGAPMKCTMFCSLVPAVPPSERNPRPDHETWRVELLSENRAEANRRAQAAGHKRREPRPARGRR